MRQYELSKSQKSRLILEMKSQKNRGRIALYYFTEAQKLLPNLQCTVRVTLDSL